VPGVFGLIALGDRVRPGWAVPAALAFAAAVSATVVLARSPALPVEAHPGQGA
jgi:hypothetical protein